VKKTVLSPLCSALVIPGLGQILNQDLKKGAFILMLVFVLFLGAVTKLYVIIRALVKTFKTRPDPATVMDRLGSEDLSALWILLAAFALLWLYSVVDAYRVGKKADHAAGEGPV